MSGNLGTSSSHSGSLGLNQDQERKRVVYMRELAENYIEAVEDVVRDSNLEVSVTGHPGSTESPSFLRGGDPLNHPFERLLDT